MLDCYSIAEYARISVDDDLNRDNVSIENQKSIMDAFVKQKFPNANVTVYVDRDRSGYTFEQREGYQAMRKLLMNGTHQILIVKDFSRFSRRNSRGLVELEDLRDAGVRIISVTDNIDFPTYDDWVAIQFRFLVNEMPVTDASKKMKAVVRNRQSKGEWICCAPFGYIINKHKKFEVVPAEAEIVRLIFQLYIDGLGYHKIAKYLTHEGYPTPRMCVRDRKEADGFEYKCKVSTYWTVVSVHTILSNDFYIGTYRQHKSTNKKINGKQERLDQSEHLVFENHHQAIIDEKTFAMARSIKERRTKSDYRGIKKNDTAFSGFLFCGDCGNPLFYRSCNNRAPSYHCGLYHRMGKKACTSHYIRVDILTGVIKTYIAKVKENSINMIDQLNKDIASEQQSTIESDISTSNLESRLDELKQELKATKRQRIKEAAKHPEREELIDETYDELENDLLVRIDSVQKQIVMMRDKESTVEQIGKISKTAFDVFDDILAKERLEKADLELIIQKILVHEDHVEVRLQSDIEKILNCTDDHDVEEIGKNFLFDTSGNSFSMLAVVNAKCNRRGYKAIGVNVVREEEASPSTLTLIEQFIVAFANLCSRMRWK